MISYTAGYLLIIALLSLLKWRHQFDRIMLFLLTVAFFVVFYNFLGAWNLGVTDRFSLMWNSSPAGDVMIDIVSSPQNDVMLFPFFVISSIALFHNYFFRYEIHKKNLIGILMFNLFCFIMLIAGNNFIQMITFVFIIDILCQFFIKDIDSGRKYAVCNLIADMGLFGVLAILNGHMESFDLKQIGNFAQPDIHRDYIAAILLISLWIKFGFAFFCNYMVELKNVRYHRLVYVLCLSTPSAAFVLFYRLYPLLVNAPFFFWIFNAGISLTLVWSAFCIFKLRDLKDKAIQFNVIFFALLAKILESSGFVWNIHLSWILILNFAFQLGGYYLFYYFARGRQVKFMPRMQVKNFVFKMFWLLFLLLCGAYAVELYELSASKNIYWTATLLLVICFMAADMLNSLPEKGVSDQKPEHDFSAYPVILTLFVVAGLCLRWQRSDWPFALIADSVFVLCYLFLSSRKKKLQTWENATFHCGFLNLGFENLWRLIMPKKYFSFESRFTESVFTQAGAVILTLFRKVNRWGLMRYAFLILMGILIFIWCFRGMLSNA